MKFNSVEWKSIVQKGSKHLGIDVSNHQLDMMAIHANELIKWNRKKNLTAITKPADVAVKHFIDSVVPCLKIPEQSSIIDVGSGGGFPGIPLKIMLPSTRVTLVDASRKKVNFLKQVIRLLDLKNIDAIHARIEDLADDPRYCGSFDTAISRAFTELDRFIRLATPLLQNAGQIIAMKSKKTDIELKKTKKKLKIETYSLPLQEAVRTMVIINCTQYPLFP